jgi:hypothetical protein
MPAPAGAAALPSGSLELLDLEPSQVVDEGPEPRISIESLSKERFVARPNVDGPRRAIQVDGQKQTRVPAFVVGGAGAGGLATSASPFDERAPHQGAVGKTPNSGEKVASGLEELASRMCHSVTYTTNQ